MNDQLYCDVRDCDRPVAGHGQGKCSSHLKQIQRTGRTMPITPKLTPEQRAVEAGIAMLDAQAEDDDGYARHRRAFLAAIDGLSKARMREAIVKALAGAKSRGVRLGRPRKVSDAVVRELFSRLQSVEKVATALGVSERTVQRRL